jgi:pimeloyl-ACP methyl ester carboxylesterase/DNA-binding CsgD family transcriptional regulator
MAGMRIGFCRVADGSQVAYATAGEGPPLVLVPGWLSHVEHVWGHPAAASSLTQLSAGHQFVWYDRIGGGLSDRARTTSSLDDDLEQLEAVLAAVGVDRCRLLGYSAGGPAAVAFAAAAPERVERLVLCATWARGADLAPEAQFRSLVDLIGTNWKLASLTMSALFLPNGSSEDVRWFTKFQRRAADPAGAVALLEYIRSQDVSGLLSSVRAPTTVLTNRHDPAVPPDLCRALARSIPGAELHVLEGSEHDPFIRDAGETVPAILAAAEGRPFVPASPPAVVAPVELSGRETEVLALIGGGATNKDIARSLGIGLATVERHVTNLYRKLDARGRADAAVHAVARGLVPPRR